MVLVIDNYDSFVFNLARYIAELGVEARVVRNDSLSVSDIEQLAPQAIVLSPGPCTPNEAGVCVDVVRYLGPVTPILGVCLGHQAIAAALGGQIVRAPEPVHGRTTSITHDGSGVFQAVPSPLQAMRYHSLVAQIHDLPAELLVNARNPQGLIMGLRHLTWPVHGVQFHPESILTEHGHTLLRNFLTLAGITSQTAPPAERTPEPTLDDFYQRDMQPGATALA